MERSASNAHVLRADDRLAVAEQELEGLDADISLAVSKFGES